MRTTALLLFFVFLLCGTSFAQEKINKLYFKTDRGAEKFVQLEPVEGQCTIDKSDRVKMVFEGKEGESNYRLTFNFVRTKKNAVRIRVDDDGDLKADQRADVEVFGMNPAVDKFTYAVEDPKDEAGMSITYINTSTGDLEGVFYAKYWDSAMNTRKANAAMRIKLRLAVTE